LDGCKKITDKGLIIISKNCLKLEDLNLSCNKCITDASLIEISKNCKNLKKIDLER
jgi:F-box and leucine-rich repeat protein GRR1